VTGALASQVWQADGARDGATRRDQDICAYRCATQAVVAELAGLNECPSVARAERLLLRRLGESDFTTILSATPAGPDAAIDRVLREIRTYRLSARNAADSLAAMVRISLLAQIDALWWGWLPAYETDEDVEADPGLLDLDALRRDDKLLFRYRRQTSTFLGRAARSAERVAAPDRTPHTAGLRFACARAELIVVLNQVAAQFAMLAPRGTPPMWVTSVTRSVSHQRHLRALGYAALLPSAHCVGYAADVEVAWFRRFRADEVLRAVLLDRQRTGEINVIDEGQAWHVCLRPGAGRALRLVPEPIAGS
jgi:hypothetical protein